MKPLDLAKKAAQVADSKKSQDVLILDLRKLSSVTDFFVICGSESVLGVKAIAEAILLKLKEEKITPNHVEGLDEGNWVLADYGDVIVHVFLERVRTYYDLESLWGDAPRKNFRPRARKKVSGKKT
ncbi:MAG: ribosome silencing factor [Candidatus Abyssobacteria bacterium SURF_5]|uniref:Ribosomal silencing factor RsfS n=1 Tax=Abyssobacteria bacterium (strain SURF_5) TaxID=2093360 RepID=A0A3A4NQ15_ABYX5|nr:MAG: ribosome silencing factor [Candidatus Abyssubacteria bacterium SURF_5]